ncbi:MAG: 4-(cytidine 5'-diphospho)-2-C-methyl-D-erythritol kinase [Paludibacteraceae bacterium]|nr:4-(cytidine 5'-diphospho)-2-C-methyl-D-erythritol kinase [Paludibacteraceae bacterium]
MIYPNSKINIGLNVVSRRPDGYHELETVFLPIGLHDELEVTVDLHTSGCALTTSGIPVLCPESDNLIVRAYNLMRDKYDIGGVRVHLHKQVPFGAGLGGGSADAAYMLIELNRLFAIGLSETELESYAAQLGADCPFFIRNAPVYATGIGNIFQPVSLHLSGMWLMLVKPEVSVSTAEAYRGIRPHQPQCSLKQMVEQRPIATWRDHVVNDFETTVFPLYPEIKHIKQQLYELGAAYASMSGSGSSVYGFFEDKPMNLSCLHNCFVYVEHLR